MILLLTTWTWNMEARFCCAESVVNVNWVPWWLLPHLFIYFWSLFRIYSYRLLCWILLLKCTFKGLNRFFFGLVRVHVSIIFLVLVGLLPGKLVLRTYWLMVCGKSSSPFGSSAHAFVQCQPWYLGCPSLIPSLVPQCFPDLLDGVYDFELGITFLW